MRTGLACGLTVLFICACAEAAPAFRRSVEEARAGANESKEVVLYFSASWCGWCRRMEADVFSHPDVKDLVSRYSWVKVDIEEQPELAARYRVRSVPAFIKLGAADEVVASTVGRLSTVKLREFLEPRKTRNEEQPPADDSKPGTTSEPAPLSLLEIQAGVVRGEAAFLIAAVDRLSRSDRVQRAELLRLLASADRSLWPDLWRLMQSDRLARRAAAAEALETATHAGLPFHPFASLDKRQQQTAVWKQWLQDHGILFPDVQLSDETAAEAEIPDPPNEETLKKRAD